MPDSLRRGLERYLTPAQLQKLRSTTIGIAGAGGLGSNAAIILARSGIEQLLLIDHDIIEVSNLNRQHYWPRQVGQPKVQALAEQLRQLNPHMRLQTRQLRLSDTNIPALVKDAPIWLEALDDAALKTAFVTSVLASARRVVCASGLAGYAGAELRKRKMASLVAVGDFCTSIDQAPPLAPRVMQAAAMMADTVLEWILDS